MIKILYDDQAFNLQKYGGISRYFSKLINGIKKDKNFSLVYKKYFNENYHLREENLRKNDWARIFLRFKLGKKLNKHFKVSHENDINKYIGNGNFDIFHPTYYDNSFLKYLPNKIPFVLTVHDMIHELYYDKMSSNISIETKTKYELMQKSSHIIAVSKNTKDDILKLYPNINSDKITVIYHGPTSIQTTYVSTKKNYILFVGHRNDYKNFNWFLESVASYLLENNIKLISAGSIPFTEDEKDLIKSLGVSLLVDHISIYRNDQLVNLYRNAICFIYPSIYEGFGIPILEAFASYCPVLASDTACFQEIGLNAICYFDLQNPEDLRLKLHNIYSNKADADKLIDLGLKRLNTFNWETSIKSHIEVYKKILDRN